MFSPIPPWMTPEERMREAACVGAAMVVGFCLPFIIYWVIG